jgi:hypothetical protein
MEIKKELWSFLEVLSLIDLFFNIVEEQYNSVNTMTKNGKTTEAMLVAKQYRALYNDYYNFGQPSIRKYNSIDHFVKLVEYLINNISGKAVNFILYRKVYDFGINVITYYTNLHNIINEIKAKIKEVIQYDYDLENNYIKFNKSKISDFMKKLLVNGKLKYEFNYLDFFSTELYRNYIKKNPDVYDMNAELDNNNYDDIIKLYLS